MNNWKIYKKCDDFRVAAPKSVSDLVEIKSIAENGIFEVGKGGIFTKTYTFTDINYATASVDEQISMLESWCRWLNSNSAPFKITWNNKNKNEKTLREEVLFPLQQDRYDKYRGAFNTELEDRIMNGRKGIEQQMYLTIRYDKSTQYEDARVYFDTIENNMVRNFAEIGSELRPLNATERLRILHDFYRFGDEEVFNFNFRLAVNSGWDFLDSIVNTRLDFKRSDDYFMTDDKYVTCLYLKDYQTSSLSDRFLTRLMGLNIKMMGSVDAVPIPDSAVNDLLKAKYIGIENRIRKQNKSRVKEMDFNSDISLPVQMERDEVKKLIKEKNDEDQHFLYSMLNIFVIADTLEELKRDVALLIETAKDNSVVLAISYTMQREALNTILPIGVRQVENGRNMQTKGLAALFPFNVQAAEWKQPDNYKWCYLTASMPVIPDCLIFHSVLSDILPAIHLLRNAVLSREVHTTVHTSPGCFLYLPWSCRHLSRSFRTNCPLLYRIPLSDEPFSRADLHCLHSSATCKTASRVVQSPLSGTRKKPDLPTEDGFPKTNPIPPYHRQASPGSSADADWLPRPAPPMQHADWPVSSLSRSPFPQLPDPLPTCFHLHGKDPCCNKKPYHTNGSFPDNTKQQSVQTEDQ